MLVPFLSLHFNGSEPLELHHLPGQDRTLNLLERRFDEAVDFLGIQGPLVPESLDQIGHE